MKRFFKTSAILSLTFAVLLFSIFCCCLSDTVQAKETTPSCHQTEHKQESSSQHKKECDCHKNFVTYQVEAFSGFDLLQTASFIFQNIHTISRGYVNVASSRIFYESPPNVSSNIPLYIQNSVLRI